MEEKLQVSRPADLPDFERPPLVEVTLGVEFAPLQALRGPHIGVLWQKYRDDYPIVEAHGALPSAIERFDQSSAVEFQVELSDAPPPVRTWFLRTDKSLLLQVQPDRFIHNWRHLAPQHKPYPRYASVRNEFKSRYETFRAFVRDEGLGDVEVLQGEINYVNLIQAGEVWNELGELDRVMRTWHPGYAGQHLSFPEDIRILERHRVQDPHDSPARLYISAVPAVPAESAPSGVAQLLLTLTLKGRPQDSTGGVLDFFDFGHEQIVRAFAAITTDAIQTVWGRIQ